MEPSGTILITVNSCLHSIEAKCAATIAFRYVFGDRLTQKDWTLFSQQLVWYFQAMKYALLITRNDTDTYLALLIHTC